MVNCTVPIKAFRLGNLVQGCQLMKKKHFVHIIGSLSMSSWLAVWEFLSLSHGVHLPPELCMVIHKNLRTYQRILTLQMPFLPEEVMNVVQHKCLVQKSLQGALKSFDWTFQYLMNTSFLVQWANFPKCIEYLYLICETSSCKGMRQFVCH